MLRMFAVCGTLLALAIPARAQNPPTPHYLLTGLDAYVSYGHDSALAIWERGSPVRGQGQQVRLGLEGIETSYGKATGYEILASVAIGSSVERTYLVVDFEHGPLYAWFDSYTSSDGQIMVGFLFDTKPQNILPPAMLTPGVRLR